MNRGLQAMGGKIVKRYRVYERLLSSKVKYRFAIDMASLKSG